VIKKAPTVGDIPVLVGAKGSVAESDGEQPVVNLIMNSENGALIEGLCSCGKKIVIECEYK